MKRQRGRGRKPGHHNSPNRSFESAGPDVKVRGSATHVYERYLQLARDAASSGDRVVAENYLQHAEHYYRILRATQPLQPRPDTEHRYPGDFDEGDDEEGEYEAEGYEAPREQQAPREAHGRERDGRPSREPREAREPREPRQEQRQPREYREPRENRESREPRFERPREPRAPEPVSEGAEAAFEPVIDRDGGDPAFRRRRSRRRFRSGEAREPGADHDHDAPVEGFGDQLPAFVASE